MAYDPNDDDHHQVFEDLKELHATRIEKNRNTPFETYQTIGLQCEIRNTSTKAGEITKIIPINYYDLRAKFPFVNEYIEDFRKKYCKVRTSCDDSMAEKLRNDIYSDILDICNNYYIQNAEDNLKQDSFSFTELYRTKRLYKINKGSSFSKPKEVELEFIFRACPINWVRDDARVWKVDVYPNDKVTTVSRAEKYNVLIDRRPLPKY